MVGICFFAPFAYTDSSLDVLAVSEGVFECFGASELERINKISNPSGRALSLGGLIALGRAVREFSPTDQKLTIVRDRFGKPSFECGGVAFSIAHAGDLSVAAVSRDDIGVDIERIDTSRDMDRIAGRFFSDGEKKQLSIAENKTREFYRIWTAKEAMMKLGGEGMISIMSSDSATALSRKERFFAGYEISFGKEDYILTLCSKNEEKIEIIECEGLRVLGR